MKFLNLRGPNGSGKTTLLRCLARDPLCRVVNVHVPDHSPIPVTYTPAGIAMIGDYTPNVTGTTAGCDRIKTQAATKGVLELLARDPDVRLVVFEGVVIATIFEPWLNWERANGGMVWAFLDTPLDVCLARIQARNGGKAIKEDQVSAKHRTIRRVRDKVLASYPERGHVADLRWETALKDLKAVVACALGASEIAADDPVWPTGQALPAPVRRSARAASVTKPTPAAPIPPTRDDEAKTIFRNLVRLLNDREGRSLPATEADFDRARVALRVLIIEGYGPTLSGDLGLTSFAKRSAHEDFSRAPGAYSELQDVLTSILNREDDSWPT